MSLPREDVTGGEGRCAHQAPSPSNKMRSLLVLAVAALVAVISWYLSLPTEHTRGSPFYPFKSEAAKCLYMEYYKEREKRLPSDGESHMVSTSYGDTHVRVDGPITAKPIVLLPGDSETLLDWEYQLPALSQGYRTYAVDNVNDFGKSINSRTISTPRDYIEWLESLLEGLDINGRVKLIGFSYGGWISSLFALQYSERLSSLILLAPPATVLAPGLELLVRGILQHVFPYQPIVYNYLSWYHPDSSEQDVEDRVNELLLSTSSFESRNFVVPTVLNDDEWNQISSKLPILFMVGEHDVTYSPTLAIERLSEFNNVKTILIPSAGHDLRSLRPDKVNHEILAFLETIT